MSALSVLGGSGLMLAVKASALSVLDDSGLMLVAVAAALSVLDGSDSKPLVVEVACVWAKMRELII